MALSAGQDFTCAVLGGAAECWGVNQTYELGTGQLSQDSPVPVAVQGLASGVTAISVGGGHSCAVMNGAAHCWGTNEYGELGVDGATMLGAGPFQVPGLTSGVTDVSSGAYHACAIVDGGAWCWGAGRYGARGDGTMDTSAAPVPVQGLSTGVTAIVAGDFSTCAIVDGGVQCWGLNERGQLGDGTTTNSAVPVRVQGLDSGVTALSMGDEFACVLVNGGVRCWGYNTLGELGDGSQHNSSVPVQVQLL